MSKYVILGPQRSGTYFLVDFLQNYNDEIISFGELFHNGGVFCSIYNDIKEIHNINFFDKVNAYNELITKFDNISVKILLNHGIDILNRVLSDKKIIKIYLNRKNILSQFISYNMSIINKIWYIESSNIKYDYDKNKKKVNFSAESFLHYVINHEYKLEETKKKSLGEFHVVEYHKLKEKNYLDDYICNIFKLKPKENYKIKSIKMSNSKKDDVENYDEMVKCLTGSEFEWMLNDLEEEKICQKT